MRERATCDNYGSSGERGSKISQKFSQSSDASWGEESRREDDNGEKGDVRFVQQQCMGEVERKVSLTNVEDNLKKGIQLAR